MCPAGKRSHPPEILKRELRQEAAFGCCKCGRPFIQYHHIIPWPKIQKHDVKHMMVLCPNCHDEATQGSITTKEQRDYKADPYNVKNGYSQGFLKINDESDNIVIGTNIFNCNGKLIVVDGEELVSARLDENGNLDFSLKLYNESNNLVLNVQNNEWVTGDVLPWDIKARYQSLVIQRKSGEIIFEIDTRTTPIKIRADLWKNHANIIIDEKQLLVNGGFIILASSGSTFNNCHFNIDTTSRYISVTSN